MLMCVYVSVCVLVCGYLSIYICDIYDIYTYMCVCVCACARSCACVCVIVYINPVVVAASI